MHSSKPKRGVEGSAERAVEGVEVGAFGRRADGGEKVEGHGAGRPVQIQCHSVRVRRRDRHFFWFVVVPGGETLSRAEQTPGLIVPSDAAVIPVSSPVDSSVCNSYLNPSFPPDLPVAPASQTFSTQQLSPSVKPLRMIGVQPFLFHQRRQTVVVRHREVLAGCG